MPFFGNAILIKEKGSKRTLNTQNFLKKTKYTTNPVSIVYDPHLCACSDPGWYGSAHDRFKAGRTERKQSSNQCNNNKKILLTCKTWIKPNISLSDEENFFSEQQGREIRITYANEVHIMRKNTLMTINIIQK